jgi:hypothetical protein
LREQQQAKIEAKKKVVEEKTFGLKNKNKSKKVQQKIEQMKSAVTGNTLAPLTLTSLTHTLTLFKLATVKLRREPRPRNNKKRPSAWLRFAPQRTPRSWRARL